MRSIVIYLPRLKNLNVESSLDSCLLITYIAYVALDLASAEPIEFVLELKRLDIL